MAFVAASLKLDWNGDVLKKYTHEQALQAVKRGAKIVLARARKDCPVEKQAHTMKGNTKTWGKRVPGALKASGRINPFDMGGVVGAYIVFGGRGYMSKGVDTYYAPFVSLGTPGHVFRGKKCAIAANPYLQNAARNSRNAIKAEFKWQGSIK